MKTKNYIIETNFQIQIILDYKGQEHQIIFEIKNIQRNKLYEYNV